MHSRYIIIIIIIFLLFLSRNLFKSIRGGGKYAPPLTPNPAGEATAFPIYLILKVKQDEHDTVLAKKSLESNPKQKNILLP